MARILKNTATIFGGYLYQNLVGLSLLCDWLSTPGLFSWVKFEADDEEDAKGLDDIVAQRPDGGRLLWQVKFTVDPHDTENVLSWDWLLNHKPKGKSLLQKWAAAVEKTGSVAEAALVTNRLPDRGFNDALDPDSRRLVVEKIPSEIRQRIDGQIGGRDRADAFLSQFEFRHSHQGDSALERSLMARFIPHHTSQHGWLSLYREAISWATLKGCPAPNGRIELDLLRGVIEQCRPEPLLQYFKIPLAYRPPDAEWSDRFHERILTGDDKVIVLWGSPGQGKSTFLSYLCEELERRETPYIRHHYFLDLLDRSERLSLHSVADSLITQMEVKHTSHVVGLHEDASKLREWIEACAEGYAAQGKKFVVLIDGLDHVWRENDRNRDPLNHLFKHLLPAPDNMLLVIGTQRVSDSQLPQSFTQYVDDSCWVEIPRMSRTAVAHWTEEQYAAKRFEVPEYQDNSVTEVAEALHRLSEGHPLILTYIFEQLSKEKRVLTAYVIDNEPLRPGGDIVRYYRLLWQQLEHVTRDALHLIAEAGFTWPLLGLEGCLGIRAGSLSPQIGHLFYATEAGPLPFHGSLLAFVREDSGHAERVSQCFPKVISWLEREAPEFLRWGWLWIYQARDGKPDNLLNLATRDWAIDSLVRGYPRRQIIEVLDASERLAYRGRNYPLAVRHRWLKIRMENGPNFQIDEYDRVETCALLYCEDEHRLKVLRSENVSSDYATQAFLAKQYVLAGDLPAAFECQERIRKSINDRLHARSNDADWFDGAIPAYLEVATATKKYDPARLLSNIHGFRRTAGANFSLLLRCLVRHDDLSLLLAFANLPMQRKLRIDLELLSIRLAGRLRAQIHAWPEFTRFKHHPIVECWRLLYDPARYRQQFFDTAAAHLDLREGEIPDRKQADSYLHSLFFHSLARSMVAGGGRAAIPVPNFKKRTWLNEAAARLVKLAAVIAQIIVRRERPPFNLPLALLSDVEHPPGFEHTPDFYALKSALLLISEDLFYLCSALDPYQEHVPQSEWDRFCTSPLFVQTTWIKGYIESSGRYLSASTVQQLIDSQVAAVKREILRFNERCSEYVELCELAVHAKLGNAVTSILRKVFDAGILAYGWRKDASISNVIEAVEALADVAPESATALTERIAPIVMVIDEMTEDDSARPSSIVPLVLKIRPESFVRYYAHWLDSADWYNAELAFGYFVEHADLNSPMADLAMSALWDGHAVSALRRRAKSGEAPAQRILDHNAALFGLPVADLGKEERYSSPETGKQLALEHADYPPAGADRLFDDLREGTYTYSQEFLKGWFKYWVAKGEGVSLLRWMQLFTERDVVPSEVAQLLDAAFELSYRLEGKAKAYGWLVKAQVQRFGWDVYHHSYAEAAARFKIVAERYPADWERFLQDTSKSPYRSQAGELYIPHTRLAQFLVAVGQIHRAIAVVEAMAEITIDEFSDQPIPALSWMKEPA